MGLIIFWTGEGGRFAGGMLYYVLVFEENLADLWVGLGSGEMYDGYGTYCICELCF